MIADLQPGRPRSQVAGTGRRVTRIASSAFAVVAIVIGAVWYVGVSVLRERVLDEDIYLDALDDTDAYRRVYSEVLTDSTVRNLLDELFDGLAELGVDRQDASAVGTAALRLAAPPAVLREAAAALTSGVVSYVRGDRSTLEAPMPVLAAVQRVDPAVAVFVRDAVATLSALLIDDLEEIESFARTVADGLADGQIPPMVPLIGGRFVAERQLVGVLDGPFATLLPAEFRAAVLDAIRSDDDRDALISWALAAMRSSLHELTERLSAGGDIDVDVINVLDVAFGDDGAQVAVEAGSIRRLVAWAPSWSRYAGLVSIVAGGNALVALHRRRRVRALVGVGVGLTAAGTSVWLAWSLLSGRLAFPLRNAAAPNGVQPVPAGARLLADIDDAIFADLSSSFIRPAQALVVVGAVAVGVASVSKLWSRRSDAGRRRVIRVLMVSMLANVAVNGTASPGPVLAERRCNGHAQLCDRRYDDIVQAATHNSMSSPDVVRVWPEHDGSIRDQLDYGIRTLMLDATYWDDVDMAQLSRLPGLLTASTPGASRPLISTITRRLTGRPGVYLCHSQCALGALSMSTALDQVKAFLNENPDEVVTLLIQDGVDTAEVEHAFRASRLEDLVYDGADDDWPTLGELIDRGQRLVVFSEQHAPPPTWYRSAFEDIQDTPYGPRSPDEFSCAPNRGPRSAPLFLLNHWVERQAPDRAQAATANARAFIVERARRCATERGMMPNFIAVSFYRIGDVLGAVDELNGITQA